MRVRACFPVVTVEARRVRLNPASWPKFGLIKRFCRPSGCPCVLARGDGRTRSWGAIPMRIIWCGDCPARPCRLSRRSAAGARRGGQSSLFGLRGHGRAQSQFDRDARSLAEERRRFAQARRSLHRRPPRRRFAPAIERTAQTGAADHAHTKTRPPGGGRVRRRRPRAPLSAGSPRSPAKSGTD